MNTDQLQSVLLAREHHLPLWRIHYDTEKWTMWTWCHIIVANIDKWTLNSWTPCDKSYIKCLLCCYQSSSQEQVCGMLEISEWLLWYTITYILCISRCDTLLCEFVKWRTINSMTLCSAAEEKYKWSKGSLEIQMFQGLLAKINNL